MVYNKNSPLLYQIFDDLAKRLIKEEEISILRIKVERDKITMYFYSMILYLESIRKVMGANI